MLQKQTQPETLTAFLTSNGQRCLTQMWSTNLKQDDEGKAHSQDHPELRSQTVVLIAPVVSVAADMRQVVLFIRSVADSSIIFGTSKSKVFSPALCDIEAICHHLMLKKVFSNCLVCHRGRGQSVINVTLHAAATNAQNTHDETQRSLNPKPHVIRCFYQLKHD